MAQEILTAWFTSLTLYHKKRQRTKQEVFQQTKLEVFLQVSILHGINSSRDLRIRGYHLRPIYTAENFWYGSDTKRFGYQKISTATLFTRPIFYRAKWLELTFWRG